MQELNEAGETMRHTLGCRGVPRSVYSRVAMASVWVALDEFEPAMRFLEEAERQAAAHQSSFRYNAQFADKSEESLLDFDRSERLSSWLYLAKCWRREMADPDRALYCMEQAVSLADSVFDWVEIAPV